MDQNTAIAIIAGPVVTFLVTAFALSVLHERDLVDQEQELRRRFADQVDGIYRAGWRACAEIVAGDGDWARVRRAGFDAGFFLSQKLDRIDVQERCRECAAGVREE